MWVQGRVLCLSRVPRLLWYFKCREVTVHGGTFRNRTTLLFSVSVGLHWSRLEKEVEVLGPQHGLETVDVDGGGPSGLLSNDTDSQKETPGHFGDEQKLPQPN